MDYKTIKKLITNVRENHKVREIIYKYKNSFLDDYINNKLTEEDFYNLTSILSSQSRSPLWEKAVIRKLSATKNKSTDNNGDFHWNNKDYEFKISGYNSSKGLHIVQIRIWQNCDYYIQYISYDIAKPITFILTHDQMKEEIELCKASSAHGTKLANKNNVNQEVRFTIRYGSPDFKRWERKYKISI